MSETQTNKKATATPEPLRPNESPIPPQSVLDVNAQAVRELKNTGAQFSAMMERCINVYWGRNAEAEARLERMIEAAIKVVEQVDKTVNRYHVRIMQRDERFETLAAQCDKRTERSAQQLRKSESQRRTANIKRWGAQREEDALVSIIVAMAPQIYGDCFNGWRAALRGDERNWKLYDHRLRQAAQVTFGEIQHVPTGADQ